MTKNDWNREEMSVVFTCLHSCGKSSFYRSLQNKANDTQFVKPPSIQIISHFPSAYQITVFNLNLKIMKSQNNKYRNTFLGKIKNLYLHQRHYCL